MHRITRGRPKHRQNTILTDLRSKIVGGIYPPGARVPDRHSLARTFGTSSFTVHQALTELERHGFIESRGRRGTFVRRDPPHLAHYGLVFPFLPHSELGIWSKFWSALINEAQIVQRQSHETERPRRFSFFEGLDGHTDSEDYQQVCRLIEQERLAGLIFPTAPTMLVHTPLITAPNVPRVSMMDQQYVPGIPNITADWNSLITRAMDFCRERGRRRVAMIVQSHSNAILPHLLELAAARGLEMRPYWVQQAGAQYAQWAQQVAHLLFNPDQKVRPDALIIGDDHLVEPALAGVRAAGLRLRDDVEVVAHANFPWSPAPLAPITRLGWETGHLLSRCIACLDAQRRGEKVAAFELVPTVFEHEIPATTSTV